MQELIVNFLKNPGLETYFPLRDAAIQLPEFNPSLPTRSQNVFAMIEQGQLDEALAILRERMPGEILSPALHVGLGAVAAKKGEKNSAELEFHFANSLRQALLATGDGSLEKPYIVSRVAEAYGIIGWLEATPREYSMTFAGGKLLDVIDTNELGEVYFDVQIPLRSYRPS